MAAQQKREKDEPAQAADPSPPGYPGFWRGYSDMPDEMPLSGYATLLGAYAVLFGSALGVGWKRGLPDRIAISDVVVLGLATHKLARIITKDWVTSPLRAPFTRYQGSVGGGEVSEKSRGTGLRRAVGDLLTCPWCIAPWVAAGLYATFACDPRAARLLASTFASVAVSDTLQHAYSAMKKAGS